LIGERRSAIGDLGADWRWAIEMAMGRLKWRWAIESAMGD
jgi:hypothetical protein